MLKAVIRLITAQLLVKIVLQGIVGLRLETEEVSEKVERQTVQDVLITAIELVQAVLAVVTITVIDDEAIRGVTDVRLVIQTVAAVLLGNEPDVGFGVTITILLHFRD